MFGDGLAGHRGVDVEQVRYGRLVLGGHDLRPRVRLGASDLLPYGVGVVEDGDVARGPRGALAHLLLRRVECHNPRSRGRDHGLGHDEGLPVKMIEPPGERPHELQVLPLVLAHGDEVRVVEEHVGGLQHGVVEEARARRLDPALAGLVLELRHARELPKARHAVQQPAQLRVPADPALAEDHAFFGVEARGQVDGSDLPDLLPEHLRVLRNRDRVQVHDAEVVLVLVLHGDPVLERPHVVAQVQVTARLNAAEYSLFGLHQHILADAQGSARRCLMYPVPLFRRGSFMGCTAHHDA